MYCRVLNQQASLTCLWKLTTPEKSAQLGVLSSDTSLSNAEALQLFSQLLDVKFDQKFAAFKRDLEDKEGATQSQLKKLKTESKASNSFNFKGNKVQYELNISLHDFVDAAIKNISKGNLSAAISELELVQTLITKGKSFFVLRIRVPRAEDSEDEKRLRSAERRALAKIREKKRRNSSAQRSYTSTRQPLISSFFVGSPFPSVDLNLRTSASVVDREVIGQIQLPAPAALEEL